MLPRPHSLPSLARTYCLLTLCLLLSGCSYVPTSAAYRECYSYLEEPLPAPTQWEEPEYHVVFLAAAPHFDYTDGRHILPTMVKHPSTGGKSGTFGHSWLYLRGIEDGEEVVTEGGHSGERGEVQPRYFDGVMNLMDYGYVDPTDEQRQQPIREPDPIKYLWAGMEDGYFQQGHGGFKPTFAAMVPITEEKYHEIKAFIDPENYPYSEYAITRNQCSTLVAAVASMVGLEFDHLARLKVNQKLNVLGRNFQLWTDPQYAELVFPSPDYVEKGLMAAVREGKAVDATDWYFRKFPRRRSPSLMKRAQTVCLFPGRITRYVLFR